MDPNVILEQLSKSLQTFGTLQMAAESRDKLYRYNDALMQSIHSILTDCDCDEATKLETFETSLEQFTAAMKDLFPQLISGEVVKADEVPPKENPISKADPNRFVRIVEVEKFNPYHDQYGRFSTANSATLFTYRTKDPNKQHWADNAIAREKERDAAGLNGPSSKQPKKQPAKETKPKDPLGNPKAISGVERGDPMSREEANSGNANPNFSQGGGYRINCQTCVVAYEARLRGYDVQAKPNTKGSQLAELSRNTNDAWVDPATGKAVQQYLYSKNQDASLPTTPKQCRKWLDENVQPGARYTFSHGWKGRGNSGHIISVDRDSSGNLRLYDPQSGLNMTGKAVDTYLSRVRYTRTIAGTKYKTAPNLLRVDNLQFNPKYVNNILEASVS